MIMTQYMFLNSKHAHTLLQGMGINVPVESEFNTLCWYSTSEMKFYHEISVCAFCWTIKRTRHYTYFLLKCTSMRHLHLGQVLRKRNIRTTYLRHLTRYIFTQH